MERVAASTTCPSAARSARGAATGTRARLVLVLDDRDGAARDPQSSTTTRPLTSASTAAPFGFRASKISVTREAVRDVRAGHASRVERAHRELVPGSPIDWAAMMPTASPISAVAGGEERAVALRHSP